LQTGAGKFGERLAKENKNGYNTLCLVMTMKKGLLPPTESSR
jgi:hypothetical protein